MAGQWYVARNRKKDGPYSTAQLRQMAAEGQLLPADMVLEDGTAQWVPAAQVEAIFPAAGITPAPPPLPAAVAAETADWHFTQSGQQAGPVTWTRLREQASSGHLRPNDMVWKAGMPAWVAASSINDLIPKPPAVSALPGTKPVSATAMDLWHRFYANKPLFFITGFVVVLLLNCSGNLMVDPKNGPGMLSVICWLVGFPLLCTMVVLGWKQLHQRAKARQRQRMLCGLWEPVDRAGQSFLFTTDGGMIRSDGLGTKFRWLANDKVEIYEDECEQTIQFTLLSLSEHELILKTDGQARPLQAGRVNHRSGITQAA